jgi:hypothetical protein
MQEEEEKKRKAKRLKSAPLTHDATALPLKRQKKLKQPGSQVVEVAAAVAVSAETAPAVGCTKPKKRRKQMSAIDTNDEVLRVKGSKKRTKM